MAGSLPDLKRLDADTLQVLLLAAHSELEIAREKLLSRDQEVEYLKLQLQKLRRMLFGRSSEKVAQQIEQLELRLEDLETAKAERVRRSEVAAPAADPETRSSRRALPDHLPREIERHLPEHDCCPECGGRLRLLGEDVSEMLERIPATYKVIRHVRPKFSCGRCQRIVQAPAPSRPLERSMAGPALLANVLVSKFCDYVVFPVM
jgi:DNA repair exonuclease SbcCD ATPase subunit